MVVAVPIESELGLESPLAKEFLTAPYFVILEPKGEELEVKVYENPAKDPQELLEVLLSYGVKKVAAAELHPETEKGLTVYGVEVKRFPSGTPLGKVIEELFS